MAKPERLVELVEHAIQGAVAPLLARLEALEGQSPAPGPAGPPGPPGPPGEPGLRYEGVHVAGRGYTPGELVTHSGSVWYCHTATTATPGGSAPGWSLMVKRGKDARTPRDGGA